MIWWRWWLIVVTVANFACRRLSNRRSSTQDTIRSISLHKRMENEIQNPIGLSHAYLAQWLSQKSFSRIFKKGNNYLFVKRSHIILISKIKHAWENSTKHSNNFSGCSNEFLMLTSCQKYLCLLAVLWLVRKEWRTSGFVLWKTLNKHFMSVPVSRFLNKDCCIQ